MDSTLLNRLLKRAYSYLLSRFGGFFDEAEDLAVEVVHRFYNEAIRQGVPVEEQPLNLFYTIAKNRFIDWGRKQQRTAKTINNYVNEQETEPEPHDPNNDSTSELTELLDKAMAKLSDRQYAVMSLIRSGYTESQISEKTGLTANKVKYARKTAFEILKRDSALAEYMEK